ncbi:MAG: lipid asymmetry maintenance protein MlaB [Gammaproteobacteria bacterium]
MSNIDVALPESIKIDNVPTIQAMLDEHVQSAGSLTIDAAAVAHVDFCGVQFLLILAVEMMRQGRTLTWTNVSEPLQSAITLLGAEDHLGIH